MKLTTCSSRTKFIAKVMSFIWLFSLAVSVANACVLSDSRTGARWQDHAGWSQSAHAAKPVVLVAPMAGPDAVHDTEEPDSSQQACKSFCDTEQNTVAKTQTTDLPDAPPLAGPMGAGWLRAAAQTDAAWRIDAAAPPPGPAVAILFLRLTL